MSVFFILIVFAKKSKGIQKVYKVKNKNLYNFELLDCSTISSKVMSFVLGQEVCHNPFQLEINIFTRL